MSLRPPPPRPSPADTVRFAAAAMTNDCGRGGQPAWWRRLLDRLLGK